MFSTPGTVAHCLDTYQARCDREGITSEAIPSILKHLAARLGTLALTDVTTQHVEEMISAMQTQDYKPATIQSHIAYLGAAMRYARKRGELVELPYFPTLKFDNARQGFFEPAELDAICAYLPAPYADVARLGYSTGWRLSEILTLHWSQVDRQAKTITLRRTKNGHGRALPLVGDRLDIIERRWQARAHGDQLSEWVFHAKGRRVDRSYFWHFWNIARTKAGLPTKLFHDLRRTAARDMIAAGCDYQTAMQVTGHKTMSMFLRYQIIDLRGMRKGLEAMDSHRNGNGQHLHDAA